MRQVNVVPGLWLIHARTEPGNEPGTPLLLIDPMVHGHRFQQWLARPA